jgi:hypothetical protein
MATITIIAMIAAYNFEIADLLRKTFIFFLLGITVALIHDICLSTWANSDVSTHIITQTAFSPFFRDLSIYMSGGGSYP